MTTTANPSGNDTDNIGSLADELPNVPALDYNKLMAPEGDQPNIEDFLPPAPGGKGGASTDPTNRSADPAATNPSTKGNGTPAAANADTPASSSALTFTREQVMGRYPGLQVPDNATPEQVLAAIEDHQLGRLHPETVQLQRYLAGGGNVEAYMADRGSIDRQLVMGDKDLMKEVYRTKFGKSDARPDGMDDTRLDALLARKEQNGELELEAISHRDQLRGQKLERENNAKSYTEGARVDPADPKTIALIHTGVKTALDESIKDDQLFGIDLSQAGSREKLEARMIHLLTVDPKTGRSPAAALLQSNNGFVRATLALDMANQGVFARQRAADRNGAKRLYMDGLGRDPRAASSANSQEPGAVNMDKLRAPELGYVGAGPSR